MSDLFEELASAINNMASDLQKVVQQEMMDDKVERGEIPREKAPRDKKLKSIQRVTTLYKSVEDAQEKKSHPSLEFLDKSIKNIFG